jgi:hypothetical protein
VAAGFAFAAAVAALLLPSVPAAAESPQRLPDQLTDSVGAIEDPAVVEAALQELRDEDGIQLFVVVVDTFDGEDPTDWANETAELSALGAQDPLLAIAAGDRAYGTSVGQSFELSEAELDAIAVDMEDGLAADDYTAGLQTYADGMREAAGDGGSGGSAGSGGSNGSGASNGSGVSPALVGGGLALAGAAGVAALMARRSRRSGGPAVAPGRQARPAESLEELGTRANRALVAVDEAVRASDRELGFAQAEFGDAATAPFAEALTRARTALAQGFSLRQRLDDAEPETDEQRHAMLQQIVQLCSAADAELDEQTERFTELRDVAARVPQLLPALAQRLEAAQAALPTAQTRVQDLARRFSPEAVGPVVDSPREADERLSLARTQLEAAGAATSGEAALAYRAAEEAVAQAEQLLAGVQRTGEELLTAGNELPRAVSALHADVSAYAQAVPPGSAGQVGTAGLAEAVAAGRAALVYAEQSGRVDPTGALQRVTQADAALDAATGRLREQGERAQRAAASLPQALTAAQAQLAAAEDFIATHRGLVGGTARTRAAEAGRVLAEAHALAGSDPSTALAAAARAAELAASASRAARSDVANGSGGAMWGGSAPMGRSTTNVVVGGSVLDVLFGGGTGGWGGTGGLSSGGWSSGSRTSGGRTSRGGGFGGGRRSSGGGFGGGRRSGGRSSGGGRRGGRGRF